MSEVSGDSVVCSACGSDMPASAKLCLKCKNWIGHPPIKTSWPELVKAFATLFIPFALFFAGRSYEDAETARQRALQQTEVMDRLTDSLVATIRSQKEFREASRALENACLHIGINENRTDNLHDLCEINFKDALKKLDDVIDGIAWAFDTVPVSSGTYARVANLKWNYFRRCGPEGGSSCGFRQRLLHFLHGMGTERGLSIRFCPNRSECNRIIENLKNEVLKPMEMNLTDLLCSVTLDANELRIGAFMSREDSTLRPSYRELADRIKALANRSDCAHRMRERPVSSDCPYGRSTSSGICL